MGRDAPTSSGLAEPDGPPPPLPSPDTFVGRMVPSGNMPSLIAYYVSLGAMLPFLGAVAGLVAVWYGAKGVALVRAHPQVRGGIHAWFGLLFGGFWALVWLALTGFLILR